MATLYLDTETYSERPIRHGVYAYAEVCEVMLLAWALDDGPVSVWDTTTPMPAELESALCGDAQLVAHNVMFDRTVLRLGQLALDLPVERWHCTMAQAMAHSLPGKLADLCTILRIPTTEAKHDGKALVQLFCKPRPKNAKIRRATRDSHPAEWAAFVAYAGQDITAMRAVHRKLPVWNYRGGELALWHLDQRINDRGVCVDVPFSRAAVESITRIQGHLAEHASDITDGAVGSTTQRDKLLAHLLSAHEVTLPDMKASTLERRLEDPDLPAPVRELIALRLEASLTSGKKHQALLRGVSADGRLRGLLRFCGAARTGRWSGQLFQPQNLMRPPKYVKQDWEGAIESIKGGAVDLIYDKPLEVISATVRGALVAPPGRKLVIADLSNIEGRVLAWLAGEQWKLDAYASGEDLYKLAYARAFGIRVQDVTDEQRQIGKVMELALGYQGAVGAFAAMAAMFGVVLPEAEVLALVRAWRKANSRISTFWYEMEDCAKQAISHAGTLISCRKVKLQRDGAWLRVLLPSGRYLCYPHARIDVGGKLAYEGTSQYTRRWGKINTYGGKLVENVTQAVARDVMAANMAAIEEAGFEIVLSVHDELVCEAADKPEYNAAALSMLLATQPVWATGLPLAAAGFETYRYRKD